MSITQEELKDLLRYDIDTGKFYHTRIRSGVSDLSQEAGCIDNGYVRIRLRGNNYRGHHLAWLYVHGELPSSDVDHINHNRSDNRISNLRLVSKVDNCRNTSKFKTNTSGVTGVYWSKSKNKWQASISVNSKHKHLGTFVEFEDACKARKEAELELGYHENHGK